MFLRKLARSFVKNHRRFRAETGRSPALQIFDIARLRIKGLTPGEYYGHGFIDDVPQEYLTVREYLALERWLNPRFPGVVMFDKWQQAQFFRGISAPHPEVYGFVYGKRGMLDRVAWHGDADALIAFVKTLPTPFAIKLIAGGHGDGFDIVEAVTDEGVVQRRGGVITLSSFAERLAMEPSGFLFQAAVDQHPDTARVAPSAVNTMRMLSIRARNGLVEIPSIAMKFARDNSHIDNVGAGAIVSHVDLETGKLSVAFEWPGKREFERHPDTGVQIAGMQIPFFDEAKAAVAYAHQSLTSAACLGWDVAISRTGPVILEFNSQVLFPHHQRQGRWLRASALGRAYAEYRASGGRPFQAAHRPF